MKRKPTNSLVGSSQENINMEDKIISKETIENLKTIIRNRNSYHEIKKVLDNLETSKVEDILKDLKDLRNHHGKSTIIDADLDKIINKYSEED